MLGLAAKRVSHGQGSIPWSVQVGKRRTTTVCHVGGQPFSDDGTAKSALRITSKKGSKMSYSHKSTTSNLNGHAVITDDVVREDAVGLLSEQEEHLADVLERENKQDAYLYGVEHGDMARSTRAVVLAGGETNNPLTKNRAMPAVPIGSCMSLIDVPINNCLKSGINKVYILTQFQSHGLHSHIAASYPPMGLGGRNSGWVDVLTAQQTIGGSEWYKGSADAIRRNLDSLEDENRGVAPASDYVILSGSAMYNMDVSKVVGFHRMKNADITICSHYVRGDKARSKGVLSADQFGRVTGFHEKPDDASLASAAHEQKDGEILVNMGVYVFKREALFKLLDPAKAEHMTHIGHHVIPTALAKNQRVYTYEHQGYWQDVSTLKDYYDANLALTSQDAPIKFFEVDGSVSTRGKMLPPARLQGTVHVDESILGDGCVLVDCHVRNSIIGERVLIGEGSVVEDTLVLGSPMWMNEDLRQQAKKDGEPIFGVGQNVTLKGCIVDENAYIGDNSVITNERGVQEADCSEKGYMIQDGIVVILKHAVIPDGTRV
jgi:glucose-1-phosphate adenylyltransferase